jgi:hypothetical protein
MAISIDRVYQKVLALANKEQRGYVTPQEFNLFAHQAQMEIFEQYFYDVNQWQRQHGNSLGYSDMLENLQEKISQFEHTAISDNVTVLNRWGDVNLEGDIPNLYRLGMVSVKYPENPSYVEAELVDNMREFRLLSESKLTRHSRKRPVYHRYKSSVDKIKIYPYPVQDDGGDIDLNTNEVDTSIMNVVVTSIAHPTDITEWGNGKYMYFNEAAMQKLVGIDYVNNEVFDVKVYRMIDNVFTLIYDDKLEFFDGQNPTNIAFWGQENQSGPNAFSSARKSPHFIDMSPDFAGDYNDNLNARGGDWEIGDVVYVKSNIYLGNQRNVKVDYIKKPKDPNWNYVAINEKALYDSSTSTDFDLHAAEESELVYRILALAGIAIQKPNLTQVAAGLGQGMTQQEKQ